MKSRLSCRTFKSLLSVLIIMLMLAGIFFSMIPTAVYAEEEGGLISDETQDAQVKALGLSAEQPERISPSGKTVDKSKNPLGPERLSIDRIYQLAVAGMKNTPEDSLSVLTNYKLYGISANITTKENVTSTPEKPWDATQRVLVAADVDGNGKQEVVTLGFVQNRALYNLKAYVTDYSEVEKEKGGYSNASVSSVYTVSYNQKRQDITGDQARPLVICDNLQAVAGDFDQDGKDEIAIAFGNKLYICRIDMERKTNLSVKVFSKNVTDLEAFDTNGDGFKELLMTLEGASNDDPAYLYIYNGTDLTVPEAEIRLRSRADNKSYYFFKSASIDVGDIFGDGEKRIVIGGTTGVSSSSTERESLSYIAYYPKAETYSSQPEGIYELDAGGGFDSVISKPDIKCVSFETPIPGKPEHIVFDGFIFKYDSSDNTFKKQEVATVSEDSSGVNAVSTGKSKGSITNINISKNKTYIVKTVAAAFESNEPGREVLVMLHYNSWWDSRIMYVTTCGMYPSGKFWVSMGEMWRADGKTPYNFPAICETDILNTGVTLEFLPEKSRFMFSNPTVIAVLGASPFYSELEEEYGALGNDGTTYGTEVENSTSASKGVTAEVGVSFGFSQGFSILGIQIGSVSLETKINNAFTWSWTQARSISKSTSFTNLHSDDAVVVTIVPYDVYYYRVYYKDKFDSSEIREEEMAMQVPYEPITTIMPLTDYNEAAKNIQNAPVIGSEVLKHTVGDPRSYPQSEEGLTNINGREVLTGDSFVACGTGDSIVSQSITTSVTNEKSFDYEFSISVSFNVSLFGVSAGVSGGAGYKTNATISTTSSTVRSGSVASVPSDYRDYLFQWKLAAYNYNLAVGDSYQECTVISYLIKPVGSYPPPVPTDLTAVERSLKSNKLQWSKVEGAAGYRVLRSESEDGGYLDISGNLTGINTTDYTDTDIELGITYYYKVLAYASKESIPTDCIEAESLHVTDIIIRKQPKLSYDEGEALILDDMTIRLKVSNNTFVNVPYKNFSDYNIETSIGNGIALKTEDTGTKIKVTYMPDEISVRSDTLIVNAISPYDLNIDVSFKVGSTKNAVLLKANQSLAATVTLQNNQQVSQQAVVFLVLYSDKGEMVDYRYEGIAIEANDSMDVTLSLVLPANVNGYTAKVFVWDGTAIENTTMTPKSECIQITGR